jgi:hypothetical protein
MQPIVLTRPSSASTRHNLYDDTTCTIRITPLTVLRSDWETLPQLAPRWSRPLDLNAYLTSSLSSISFVAQPSNRSLLGCEAQTEKPSRWFWNPNHQIKDVGFDVQTKKHVLLVLSSNDWQSVDLRFEAKPRNSRSSSPYARCISHTASSDLPIVRSPSTRAVLGYPRSSAPSL